MTNPDTNPNLTFYRTRLDAWRTHRTKCAAVTAGFALATALALPAASRLSNLNKDRWDSIPATAIASVREKFRDSCTKHVRVQNHHPDTVARGIEGCMDHDSRTFLTNKNPADKALHALTLLLVFSIPVSIAASVVGIAAFTNAGQRIRETKADIKRIKLFSNEGHNPS